MIYKRGAIYWGKLKAGGKVYQQSLRTKDEAEARVLHEKMRASIGARSGPPESLLTATAAVYGDWEACSPSEIARVARLMHLGMVHRSAKRGLERSITREQIASLLQATDGLCMVTGIPLSLSAKAPGCRVSPWMPSLDRIDSSKGYTPANCRIVCYLANIAMSQFGEDALRLMLVHYKFSKSTRLA